MAIFFALECVIRHTVSDSGTRWTAASAQLLGTTAGQLADTAGIAFKDRRSGRLGYPNCSVELYTFHDVCLGLE